MVKTVALGTVFMAWLDPTHRSKGNASASPSLEELVKPYKEAILLTSTPPAANRVDVWAWEDLIRAADTLGKPILRYSPNSTPGGRLFYVLDGPVTYFYEHGRSPQGEAVSSAPGLDGQGNSDSSDPQFPPGARNGPPSAPGEPQASSPSPSPLSETAAPTPQAQILRERVHALLVRLQERPDSYPSHRTYLAISDLRQAVVAIRDGRADVAEQRLDSAQRVMGPLGVARR